MSGSGNFLSVFALLVVLLAFASSCVSAKQRHSAVSNETHISDDSVMPNPCAAIKKTVTYGKYKQKLEDLANCKLDRDKIGDIFLEYFDPEGIQKLSITGCQLIIDTYVPQALHSAVDRMTEGGCLGILAHCDCDGNGFIEPGVMATEKYLPNGSLNPNGRLEMDANRPFCLDTCQKLETLADVLSRLAPPEAIEAAINPNYVSKKKK